MPASDPTTDVPTPTGTLQGVAAFSWDGAAWQPTGRAGPSVATPTGVLRGVAAFNGGPSWQPAALAQPGVATPSGTLDGVAVYTWSGSAWTPPGGTATPSTPHGALRGVAAFNWDGAAWQPAAQAGPSVATPYGVLDGVAMFGWSGSAWAAVGAPSLSLDFMTPGTLDPRITFTRASTATYFNSAGVMQTAATNAPRWDYNPSTLALNGLLIEEARTNLWLQSADASNAAWNTASAGGPVVPTVTGNQTTAPDGTLTAARVVYPAVNVASSYSVLYQGLTCTVNPYAFSVWLKGSVGGEQLYVGQLSGPATRCTLTTQWQRFTYNLPSAGAGTNYFMIGTDLRGPQTSTPAQTIYVWGAQVEQGGFPTSLIPTTAAAVTRAADQCYILSANMSPWFSSPGGSWMAEWIGFNPTTGAAGARVVGLTADQSVAPLYLDTSLRLNQYDVTANFGTINAVVVNAITKGASTWAVGNATISLNGGAVAVSAALTNGYVSLAASGVRFMATTTPNDGVNGYIRRARYWPRVLSNAEMQAVTT